ncbi:MAG: peptidoglycan bridge formation glycyltransferase FemA/FemB family protein [bacterium]|nr:peptidoglycan bridge formation glycyltransferase FemA/FemB family protein [bacterium]
MELIKLQEEEFKEFAYQHEQASFLQTIGWGKLKNKNGWDYEFLGFKDQKKIVAATLLLSKMTPIKKKMFYAPHGFVLDYSDYSLLDEFVLKMKKYVKEHNGIFFKIDPYLMLIERDMDGKRVDNGIDHTEIYKHLRKLGFDEINGKVTEQTLQGKWLYRIDINDRDIDEVMKDMTSKTRQMIRKNEKNGVIVREGFVEELETFKDIMDHTSERREFLSRSLSYYKNMYEILNQEGICKIHFAEIHLKQQLDKFRAEVQSIQNEYNSKQIDFDAGKLKVNEKKFYAKQKELLDNMARLEKSIKDYEQLQEKNGDVLVLGAIMYMIHGSEVISFIGGAYQEYLDFQPFYSIHYELIKYACANHYRYYNFYGISGNLVESDPMYGIYLFKKGFGGQVVELMGEFDMPVSKFYYRLYRISYAIIHKLKKLKTKMH